TPLVLGRSCSELDEHELPDARFWEGRYRVLTLHPDGDVPQRGRTVRVGHPDARNPVTGAAQPELALPDGHRILLRPVPELVALSDEVDQVQHKPPVAGLADPTPYGARLGRAADRRLLVLDVGCVVVRSDPGAGHVDNVGIQQHLVVLDEEVIPP